MSGQHEEFQLSPEDLDLVTRLAKPGVKDSTILTLDSLLTLMRLFKAETAVALGNLPLLLGLSLARGPAYLLTWIGFSLFAACGVYAVSNGNLVFAAGTFFLLQLAATLVLELRIRRLHDALDFPESRRGLAVLQASVKARLRREQAS